MASQVILENLHYRAFHLSWEHLNIAVNKACEATAWQRQPRTESCKSYTSNNSMCSLLGGLATPGLGFFCITGSVCKKQNRFFAFVYNSLIN